MIERIERTFSNAKYRFHFLSSASVNSLLISAKKEEPVFRARPGLFPLATGVRSNYLHCQVP